MPDATNGTVRRKRRDTRKRTPSPGVPLGVVEAFVGPVPPAMGRDKYPWAVVKPGERFLVPLGSRASVAKKAAKLGKVFECRDNHDGTMWVYCTHQFPVVVAGQQTPQTSG